MSDARHDFAVMPVGRQLSVVGLLVAAGLVGCGQQGTPRRSPRPIFPFSLEDARGNPLTQSDLTGGVSVVSFFLSSCTASSMGVPQRMARIQSETPESVRLFTFTVDPVGDTPEVLLQQGEKFGADPGRWRFVTGSNVQNVIRQSFISLQLMEKAARRGNDPMLEQCEQVVVVDSEGRIAAWVDGAAGDTVGRVLEVVNSLLQEAGSDPPD